MPLKSEKKSKRRECVPDTLYRVLTAVLLISGLAFMVYCSGKQTFWLDELFSVGMVSSRTSVGELTRVFLTEETCNLPLYDYLLYIWYRIVPHTEMWLILPNTIAYCLTAFLMGETARERHGNICGLIAMIIMFSVPRAMTRGVLELRSYALMMLLIMLFIYLNRRVNDPYGVQGIVVRGIVIAAACYTHYFAILVIGLWFVAEMLHRVLTRTFSFKWLIPYLIGGALFLPWAVLILINNVRDFGTFWPGVPGMTQLKDIFRILTGRSECLLIAAILGMVASVIGYGIKAQRKSTVDEGFFYFANTFVAAGTIFGVYVYSAYINPRGSLWVDRYFLSVFPSMVLLTVYGLYLAVSVIIGTDRSDHTRIVIMSAAVILCAVLLNGGISKSINALANEEQKYKATAEYILEREPGESTAILYNGHDNYVAYYCGRGWQELYLKDRIPVLFGREALEESDPDKLYMSYTHFEFDGVPEYVSDRYDLVEHNEDMKLLEFDRKEKA